MQVYIPWHLTPASSKWPYWQVTMGLYEHSVRLLSLPLQPMSSKWIWPTPAPKWAPPKATAPVNNLYSNYYKTPIKCAAKVCYVTSLMISSLLPVQYIEDHDECNVTQRSECWKLTLGALSLIPATASCSVRLKLLSYTVRRLVHNSPFSKAPFTCSNLGGLRNPDCNLCLHELRLV